MYYSDKLSVFSWIYGISSFFFHGFRTVLGHVPILPAIVSFSPETYGFDVSSQEDAFIGFILLFRRPLPHFSNNNHIQCAWQCFGPTCIAVYVAFVHIYFRSVYITSSEFCTRFTTRNVSCASYFDPRWFTRTSYCSIDPSCSVMTLVEIWKRSKYSWFVSNFFCLHQNTDM